MISLAGSPSGGAESRISDSISRMRARVTPSNDTTRASAIRASWMVDAPTLRRSRARGCKRSESSAEAVDNATRVERLPWLLGGGGAGRALAVDELVDQMAADRDRAE